MTVSKQGVFPKFTDQHDDWKPLIKEDNNTIYYRIANRTNRRIDITIKAKDRATAVGRRIRSLLSENQNHFNISGAGVTITGGALPIYDSEDDGSAGDEVIAYTQDYRYTLNPF